MARRAPLQARIGRPFDRRQVVGKELRLLVLQKPKIKSGNSKITVRSQRG